MNIRINKLRLFLLNLPREIRLIISFVVDTFLYDKTVWLKFYLRIGLFNFSSLKLKNKNYLKAHIEILITGLRPVEKLFEELLIQDKYLPKKYLKIFKAQYCFLPWKELSIEIDSLGRFIYKNYVKNITLILRKLIIGYTPRKEIVDWIFNENIKKNSERIIF
ncbi:hypothetical protein CU311_06615 [Prochlorococcus marinus str. MU1402]|uniref:polysaccharide biosynthesis protein n=1 Tax=Prochlorococcus marinus TaxID=1219 RepID=UPI001ADBD8AA|nr:polysaccharide biosynthesis protein [Prochlorococcus marinus]MBO8232351.1 polysaccharide biosynthesis protein [Prochlorococcus marinus XMU1402]MBW3057079.1 hypothetical protein [Prochlorococcus marinus str. MU1402]